MIAFTVPALPVAQPRQRHRVASIGGRMVAQNYTPTKSPANEFKATVKMAAAQAYSGPPLEGPLVMSIVCVFPSKKKARTPKATKPDCDNLAKAVADSLNGLTYKDDGQIVSLFIQKWHAGRDEQPHVEIVIEEVTQEQPK